MLNIVVVAVAASLFAEPNVAGTWVMSVHGHQVGLQLEQDGKRVTGTIVLQGRQIPLTGEFGGVVLTLTDAAESDDNSGGGRTRLTLTATLQEDGTLMGDLSGLHGQTLTWTAERLRGGIAQAHDDRVCES